MNLYGQVLPQVNLRFDNSSKYATEPRPMTGIRRFGPYDANLFAMNEIRCGIIYPQAYRNEKEAFVKSLVNVEGQAYHGFKNWFRVGLRFDQLYERAVSVENAQTIQQAATDLAICDCDLVFILVTQRNEEVYSKGKGTLLSNGIPCQYAVISKLRTNQRPWLIANIALAAYAKVGGTPWVVADAPNNKELIMGVSRAQDKNKKHVVGLNPNAIIQVALFSVSELLSNFCVTF